MTFTQHVLVSVRKYIHESKSNVRSLQMLTDQPKCSVLSRDCQRNLLCVLEFQIVVQYHWQRQVVDAVQDGLAVSSD